MAKSLEQTRAEIRYFKHTTAVLAADATEVFTLPDSEGFAWFRVMAQGSVGPVQFTKIEGLVAKGGVIKYSMTTNDPAVPIQTISYTTPIPSNLVNLEITLKNKHTAGQTITLEGVLYPDWPVKLF